MFLLIPAHLGRPGQRAVQQVIVVAMQCAVVCKAACSLQLRLIMYACFCDRKFYQHSSCFAEDVLIDL